MQRVCSFLLGFALLAGAVSAAAAQDAATRTLGESAHGVIFTAGLRVGAGSLECDCSSDDSYAAGHLHLRVLHPLRSGLLMGVDIRQGIVSLVDEYHGGVYSATAQWYPVPGRRLHLSGRVGLMHSTFEAEDSDSDRKVLDALALGVGIGVDLWRRPSSTLHLHLDGDFAPTGRFRRGGRTYHSGTGSLVQFGVDFSFR